MNAIWLDNPNVSLTNEIWTKIENHIALLAQNNPTYFKAEEVKTPTVTVDQDNKTVKEVIKTADNTYKVVLNKATEGTAESQTLLLTVTNGTEGATYTWTSNNTEVATVENGLVTFKGVAGTVTITATPVAATRSISETAAYSITFNVTKEGEVTEETIEVAVGKTKTVIIKGENLARDEGYTTDDPSIATVNVTGVNTGESTTKYELANSVKVTDIANSNGTNLSTKYFYLKDGAYYPLYVARSYRNYTYTYTYYYKDNSGTYQTIGVQQVYSWNLNSTNCNITLYNATTTTTTETSTTIEFTGLKENQTTYVTIGNIRYKIVVKADLTNAPKLPVQLWITNNTIQVDTTAATKTGSGWGGDSSLGNANYVNIPATIANSEQGVHMKDAFYAAGLIEPLERYEWGGTRFINAKDDKPVMRLVFWQGQVHTKANSNIQTVWGTDYSNSGTPFVYVRYWNDGSGYSWQVSADRQTWTTVTGEGSTGAYSGCTEQLAAYYMTRTEITDEITTDVADWGKPNGSTEYNSQVSGDFVLLDFAVKYYDGTQKPLNFPVEGKTLAYHCASGDAAVGTNGSYTYRKLNNFRAVNSDNFEVYMVTVRMTSSEAGTTLSASEAKDGYTYDNNTEQIVWAIDENARLASGLDNYVSISGADSVYSGCTIGGDPYVRGVEVYNKHGALITYYVREKEATDFLTVNYYVQGETTPFYTYTISVKQNTVFSQEFERLSATQLIGNTVENVIGVTQTVQWDLKLMPQIGAQYRYTDYTFTDANRESDGKTVNLYYTFNATKTFVVDFGLPLRIEPKDLNENLGGNGVNITETKLTGVSNFAYVSADTNGVITYKLKEMISQSDTFGVKYTGTLVKDDGNLQVGTTAKYTVTIIPATSVYYEDSFAKFTDGSGTAKDAKWAPVYDTNITAENNYYANTTQALEALGNKKNVYGYDPAYNNCTKFSMGSARKVTVTNDMAKDGVIWPTAQFTFKGTGFDIISLTNNTSGAIFVDVTRKVNGEEVKERSVFVDNYYGYSYENGTWKAEPNNPNAIYQVPVIKVSGLDYDEYKVVIKVAYNTFFDDANAGSYSFWLDAVRVYDPAGNTLDNDYVKDREVKPIYVEVRKALIGQDGFTPNGSGLTNGAVFIDGKSTGASIDDYKNFGPNHEVYLARDQAIAFRIVADRIPATVQIGVKLANGSSGELTLSGSNAKFAAYGDADENAKLTLNTATNMYYALNGITWTQEENGSQKSNVIVLTNTGDNSIVSITNVKCTYASITENTTNTVTLAISYDDALMAVDAVNNAITPVEPEPEPEPEPEKTFEPERFEASWSRNVMQGRKSTLTVKTSEDVEAITVDGQTIRSYRTRTERMGFGRRAKRITYREFTYSMVAQESADFSVTAINAEGTESEAITARLTVKTRPNSMRDMWDWFKGWF